MRRRAFNTPDLEYFLRSSAPVRFAVRYFVEIAFSPVLSQFPRVTCVVLIRASRFLPNSFCPRSRHQRLAQSQTSSCHYPRRCTHDMLGDYLTALLVAVLGYIYPVYLCFKVSR